MKKSIGRIAFRLEGDMWNAYWTQQTSMEGAILLGSIRVNAVVDRPTRKGEFMALMRASLSDAIRDVTGVSPSWGDPEVAPEHERASRG